MSLIRFFFRIEGDFCALFVECGIKRHIDVKPVDDGFSLQLHITSAVPDDSLFHTIGFHASTEALTPMDLMYFIPSPRRILVEGSSKHFYPMEEKPLWVIFKFPLQVAKEEMAVVADVDLTSVLFPKK